MGTIAAEFKGLPMADLIGGPLAAACDAQIRLANATKKFIQVVGFQAPTTSPALDDDVGDIRNVSFTFTRPVPAKDAIPTAVPPIAAVPAGTTETVALTVPLLAIVTIPAISIKTIDIVFDMEVKSSSSSKSAEDEALSVKVDASAKWGVAKVAVSIQGSVATHKENTRSTDNSAKYHVEVQASDTGMPEGLRRVLDIMNSAIVPVPH